MRGQTAIAGLGMTEMGKVYGHTATDFAAEALALALGDAGLAKSSTVSKCPSICGTPPVMSCSTNVKPGAPAR